MSESNQLELPEDFESIEVQFPLVEEGYYDVTVDEVTAHEDNIVHARFQVLDVGRYAGRLLFQRYVMTTPAGKRLFKEFLEAIHVEAEGNTLNLDRCNRAVLNVRVKHNHNDGKTYANVSRHIPIESVLNVD